MRGNSTIVVLLSGWASLTVQISTLIQGEQPIAYQIVQAITGQQPSRLPSNAPPANNKTSPAGVRLLNAAESGVVNFLVDGRIESLGAGQDLQLPPGQLHLVEFDTGGDGGELRYSVSQGLYRFRITPDGWALYKSAASVAASGSSTQAVPAGVRQPPLPADDLAQRRRTARPRPMSNSNGGGAATNEESAVPAPPAPGVIGPEPAAPLKAPTPGLPHDSPPPPPAPASAL